MGLDLEPCPLIAADSRVSKGQRRKDNADGECVKCVPSHPVFLRPAPYGWMIAMDTDRLTTANVTSALYHSTTLQTVTHPGLDQPLVPIPGDEEKTRKTPSITVENPSNLTPPLSLSRFG